MWAQAPCTECLCRSFGIQRSHQSQASCDAVNTMCERFISWVCICLRWILLAMCLPLFFKCPDFSLVLFISALCYLENRELTLHLISVDKENWEKSISPFMETISKQYLWSHLVSFISWYFFKKVFFYVEFVICLYISNHFWTGTTFLIDRKLNLEGDAGWHCSFPSWWYVMEVQLTGAQSPGTPATSVLFGAETARIFEQMQHKEITSLEL